MPPLMAFLSHAVLESGEGQAEAWEDCVQMMTLQLDAAKVRALGLMVSDRQAGAFELQVDRIAIER